MPSGSVAGLFPGQGSQVPELRAIAARGAPELLEQCLQLLGSDPFERVEESTRYAQPAIFCASVAGWRLHGLPEAALLAGHSLGELSALVAAGSLEASSGLLLAVRRGELMAAAGEGQRDDGMLALLGADGALAETLAQTHGVVVANDNAPGQLVLAGAVGDLRAACAQARAQGARAIMLGVAGAFHSPAMAAAVEPFRGVLAEVEFRAPAVPVFSGASAEPFSDVRRELAEAIVRPVRWRETMLALAAAGAGSFIDYGPGEVLARLVLRNLPEAQLIKRERGAAAA